MLYILLIELKAKKKGIDRKNKQTKDVHIIQNENPKKKNF